MTPIGFLLNQVPSTQNSQNSAINSDDEGGTQTGPNRIYALSGNGKATCRILKTELDELERFKMDDTGDGVIQVFWVVNGEIEIRCLRRHGNPINKAIVDAHPNIEICGRELLRSMCTVLRIKIDEGHFSFFVSIDPAYDLNHRINDLNGMPLIKYAYVDLIGSARVRLANAFFNSTYGNLRK